MEFRDIARTKLMSLPEEETKKLLLKCRTIIGINERQIVKNIVRSRFDILRNIREFITRRFNVIAIYSQPVRQEFTYRFRVYLYRTF